jgi:hypothetical protein
MGVELKGLAKREVLESFAAGASGRNLAVYAEETA